MSSTPLGAQQQGKNLVCKVTSDDTLDVREFKVEERMSALFRVTLIVLSENPDIDFEAVVGLPARFSIEGSVSPRSWTGVVSALTQLAVEERGLSTYELTIVPTLWLATQRRNHRIFQQSSELSIALGLLGEWGLSPKTRIAGSHKKRKYRVQYGESDFDFLARMLEEAGISFYFVDEDRQSRLVLSDAPQASEPRAEKIPYREKATAGAREHVTAVQIRREVRPGRVTVGDHDYRRATGYQLAASATGGGDAERRLERYDYAPGAFLFGSDRGGETPFADDRGAARIDEAEGAMLVARRLDAARSGAKSYSFTTTALDLAPGVVMSLLDHPQRDLGDKNGLLVIASTLEGTSYGEWKHRCEARSAEVPYRPALTTPKPRITGVESATVVGRPGEEIHTDEFGRVRVQFHWDRDGGMDERSSCWIHVSQPWGGAGFGAINLPRVGQEVIVDFLGGDPDRPIITGRVFNGVQKVPYALPANKTKSGWKSGSTGNTGGYNELMFDDASGSELLRVRAERDLEALVKRDERLHVQHDRARVVEHDERVAVGNDRSKIVARDEKLTIGNDRSKVVEHDERVTVGNDRAHEVARDEQITIGNDQAKIVRRDETITIGNDRSKVVAHDERVTVGNDRTKSVARDEQITVGQNRSATIGESETVSIGKGRSATIGESETLSIGKGRSATIGESERISIGESRTKTVKKDEHVTIGRNLTRQIGATVRDVIGLSQNFSVGVSRSTQIGMIDSTVVGKSHSVMVLPRGEGEASASASCVMEHEMICLTTGTDKKASIRMEGTTLVITAEKIEIRGENGVILEAKQGDMVIKGQPKVKLNPP